MPVLRRLADLVREDLGSLLPGSGIPLNRESLLRLVLYVALFLFALRLFAPGLFTFRTIIREDPPATSEPPVLEEPRPDVSDTEQI